MVSSLMYAMTNNPRSIRCPRYSPTEPNLFTHRRSFMTITSIGGPAHNRLALSSTRWESFWDWSVTHRLSPMFKKRARPASIRDRNAVASSSTAPLDSPLVSGASSPAVQPADGSASASPAVRAAEDGAEDDDDDTAQTVEEMILLRKLRRAKQGIEVEKLNKGEKSKRAPELGASEKYGLQSTKKRQEGEDEWVHPSLISTAVLRLEGSSRTKRPG